MRRLIGPALPAACLAASLAACQASRTPQPPSAPAGGSAAPPAAGVASIHGQATYLERIKMPPGPSLRVEVLDAATGRTIAAETVADVAGPPIPFRVGVPRGAATALAVRAMLVGPDGMRWLETPAPVATRPGEAVELLMRRVADAAAGPETAGVGPVAHWECGELGVLSRPGAAGTLLALSFNGRRLELSPSPSASGTRHADAQGNEFRTKGATAGLLLAGDAPRDCVRAAQPSPWNESAVRGVAFRAAGNEPGWYAEVSGAPARLHAVLDYGEREIRTTVRASADGYVGTDASTPITLRIRRESCADGMSGQRFEASVVLESAGRTYRGCGASLQD